MRMKERVIGFSTAVFLAVLLCLGGYAHSASMSDEAVLGNNRWSVTEDGDLVPGVEDTYDIGADGGEVEEIYVNTLIVGGDTVTGASQLATPMEDQGTYVQIQGDPDVKLYDNGNIVIVGDMDADSYIMENDAQLDNATNNYVTLTENSDILTWYFDGTDVSLDQSGGGYTIKLSTATTGTFDIYTLGVTGDYLSIYQGTDQATISALGSGNDLYLIAEGGDINMADENITGTGDWSIGGLTCTSITGFTSMTLTDDVLSRSADDTLEWKSNDENSYFLISGHTAKDAVLSMACNDSATGGNQWNIVVDNDDDNLEFFNETTEVLDIASGGNIDMVTGTTLTMGNDEVISNAMNNTIQAYSANAMVLDVRSTGTTGTTAAVNIQADNATDILDGWQLLANDSATGTLVIGCDSTTSETYVAKMTIAGADGDITTTGDIEIIDEMDLVIGSDGNFKFQFDEAVDDQLLIVTIEDGVGITDTDAVVQFLFPTTCDADQDLFEIGRGTQTSPTALFTVDEDGDVEVIANLDVGGTSGLVGAVTVTGDVTVNGGDLTMASATSTKPVIDLTNTTATAAMGSAIYLSSDKASQADGDDCGYIYFEASDSAGNQQVFATITGEARDVTTTKEAGGIAFTLECNDTATEYLTMFSDAGDVSTGHVEFNSGGIDIDFTVDSLNETGLFHIDGATDEVTIVTTSTTRRGLFVNADGATGTSGKAAVVIDSENVDAAALYITSPVDATGGTAQIDDYIVTVVAEGIGGGVSVYRNVTGATTALLKLEEVHAASTAELLTIASAANATTDNDLVSITASATAFNDRCLFINDDATAGATTVPAVEIDSERTTSATLVISGKQTEAGTDVNEDEAALVVIAEGVGGAAFFDRDVASATKAVVTIHDDGDTTGSCLEILSDMDASAGMAAVIIATSSSACVEPVATITQAGVGEGLTVTRTGVGADELVYIYDNNAATADHALHVKSIQNATSAVSAVLFETSDALCDTPVLQVTQAGVADGIYILRNVSAATGAVVNIYDSHADSVGSCLEILSDNDASADEAVVQIATSHALMNEPVMTIVQAGVGEGLIITRAVAGADQLVYIHDDHADTADHALEVLSDQDDTSSLAAVKFSTSAAACDDPVLEVVQGGIAEGVKVTRAIASATGAVVSIADSSADSIGSCLEITFASDGDADEAVVQISTSDAAMDEPVMTITQAGVGEGLTVTRAAAGVNDLVYIIDDNVATADQALHVVSDQNATSNVPAILFETTSAVCDQPVLQVTQAGVADGAYFLRDVASATGAVVSIKDDHIDTIGSCLEVTSDADVTGDEAAVQFITTAVDNDQVVLLITQAGVVSTNFKRMIELDGLTIWISDGTAAEGNLTGVKGDICLYGAGAGSGGLAFCDASGTNWTDM